MHDRDESQETNQSLTQVQRKSGNVLFIYSISMVLVWNWRSETQISEIYWKSGIKLKSTDWLNWMKIEEKKYIDTIFFKYVKNDKYDRNVSVIRFRKLNHRGIVF